MGKIIKETVEYYIVTGTDKNTITVAAKDKRKINTIKKNGYFKWYMMGFQDIKESKPSPGYWSKSILDKIEKVTKTIYTEVEEV